MKKFLPRFEFLLFALVPWSGVWTQSFDNLKDYSTAKMQVGKKDCSAGVPFQVTIVVSPEACSKGLGGKRPPLKEDEAMLFGFKENKPITFWMKDTHIPLGILFFDKAGALVQKYFMPVEKNPDEPTKTYPSVKPISAALEISPKTYKKFKSGENYLCIDASSNTTANPAQKPSPTTH